MSKLETSTSECHNLCRFIPNRKNPDPINTANTFMHPMEHVKQIQHSSFCFERSNFLEHSVAGPPMGGVWGGAPQGFPVKMDVTTKHPVGIVPWSIGACSQLLQVSGFHSLRNN